ncbi:hypothetical protein GCM10023205_61330 [Yinghuangia aomiensis]|uniref:Uncharacterized protein n=1 Tax=Yinghuangia aomiensis TaxID=676205 RepID=A0ABP9HZG7_9ACTN
MLRSASASAAGRSRVGTMTLTVAVTAYLRAGCPAGAGARLVYGRTIGSSAAAVQRTGNAFTRKAHGRNPPEGPGRPDSADRADSQT